jgi:hypothetical protein
MAIARATAPAEPTVSAGDKSAPETESSHHLPSNCGACDNCGGRNQKSDAGLQGVVTPDILEIDGEEIEEGPARIELN